jgi:hypothetical protein
MKTVIVLLLVLILAVLGGMFWNQLRERDDRLKAEAAIESARQQQAAEIHESERRNQESARKAAEAEKDIDKNLQKTFGY